MKRLLSLLTLLLMVCCLTLPVSASNTTTVTIQYSATCQLELKLHGKGTVKLGDTAYSRDAVLEVSRYTPVTLTFTPASGRVLEKVTVNGTTQKNVSKTLTLTDLPTKMTVEVWFTSPASSWSDNPRTGDPIALPMATLLATTLALATLRRKKA